MNYIQLSNSLLPLLCVCKFYSIPSDISFIIYKFLINRSAQCIIDSWYNHVMIHNTNLCLIVYRLDLYMQYDPFGMPFYYYDLYDKKVGITFNICYKYIDLSICDISWWMHHLTYAFNGLSLHESEDDNFIYNYDAVANLFNKLFFC